MLVAIKEEDSNIEEEAVKAYYQGKIADWQIPDRVIFVDAIPINGTGKMVKSELRDQFGDVLLTA